MCVVQVLGCLDMVLHSADLSAGFAAEAGATGTPPNSVADCHIMFRCAGCVWKSVVKSGAMAHEP